MLKKRVQAFTIDMAVIILMNSALTASFAEFLKTVFFHLPLKSQLFFIHKFNMLNSVSLLSIMFSYFSLFYFVTNGKTFGKMIFGLTVQSIHAEMTLFEAMKRAIAYIICAMTGSFLFALPFLRSDKKSLADLFSQTTVGLTVKTPILIPEENNQVKFLPSQQQPQLPSIKPVIKEDKAA